MPQRFSRASAAIGRQRLRNRLAEAQEGSSDTERFNYILQKVCQDLEDGREPHLAPDEFGILAHQIKALSRERRTGNNLPATLWLAHRSNAGKMLALYAWVLRRSLLCYPLTDDATQLDYASVRRDLGVGLAGYAASCSHGLSLALAAVRGDALRLYMALLEESATHIRAHTQQLDREAPAAHSDACSSSSSSSCCPPQPAAIIQLPALERILRAAPTLLHDSLTVVDTTRYLVSPRPDIHGPSGARIAASIPQPELLSIQLQQLGVLDRCCSMLLELLPHAARHPALAAHSSRSQPIMAVVFEILDSSIGNAAQPAVQLPCMWLGTVAGRPPLPPPHGCPVRLAAAAGSMEGGNGNGGSTAGGSRGCRGGESSSSSSGSSSGVGDGSGGGSSGDGGGSGGSSDSSNAGSWCGNNGGGSYCGFAPAPPAVT